MNPDGFLPGYLIYLLVIFVPGVGFGELLGLWNSRESLAEKVALAFVLGLSIDTIVFLIKTSGFAGLSGINLDTVYLVIGLGFVGLAASVILKRRVAFSVKPTRMDVALFSIMLIQGLMLLVYFQKYPIFPEYFTQDPSVHVGYVESLISGQTTSIPTGLLYFGVHYQLASGVLLIGGEPLVVVQRIMAILVTISPLLFFTASKKLFSSERAALIVTILYAFSASIWFAGVFDSGLYPNFFGILAVLFVLIAIVNVVESPSLLSWVIFIISLINGYMSHYTFLTILPALLVVPFLRLGKTKSLKDANFKRYLFAAIISIAPAAVPFVAFPNLAAKILSLATGGGGVQAATTTLSNAFVGFPALSFLAVEMEDDLALIVSLALVVVFLYRFVTQKNVLFAVPVVWFLALLIVAPFNISAWRFSYEAIVPLTLMSGYALYSLFPSSFKNEDKGRQQIQKRALRQRLKRGEQSQLLTITVVVILFGTLFVGAWGQMMLGDALTQTTIVNQSQNFVYQSIYWLRANTPNSSQYLSVSDWRFTYTALMIDRITHYGYIFNVTNAIEAAKNTSSKYIIVTNIVTANIPAINGFLPWQTFPTSSDKNLTLLYNNTDVRIYQIA